MPGDEAHSHDRNSAQLPAGVRLVRTTAEFDERTAPAGLTRTHRIAAGVWGRLVVREGRLGFQFEDTDEVLEVTSPGEVIIPPQRPHSLTLDRLTRFVVEFYRAEPV